MTDLKGILEELDGVDDQLMHLFLRRMEIIDRVSAYRLSRGIPVMEPVKEHDSLVSRAKIAPPYLSRYASEYAKALLAMSRHMQEAMIRRAVEEEMRSQEKNITGTDLFFLDEQ
ncbi:MAG: chorismate mutase [Oscillospiraceae bacterium]|nr:chorismate mutase [Oscillospiraceae bacterium]